jgi:hypothetical protein
MNSSGHSINYHACSVTSLVQFNSIVAANVRPAREIHLHWSMHWKNDCSYGSSDDNGLLGTPSLVQLQSAELLLL